MAKNLQLPLADRKAIEDLLGFWFAPGMEAKWYDGGPEFDAALSRRFSGLCAEAWSGRLDHWKETPHGALALLLLLDQFPRNLRRGSAQAFAQDAKARALTRHVLTKGFDREFPQRLRVFCYLPLEHSEDLADQEECLRLMAELDEVAEAADYARQHRDIIARFGRFPHRNAALGRSSTAEEEEFLREPGSSF